MVDKQTKLKTVKVSLKDMYEKGYLNICAIDKCLSLMDIIPPKEEYDMLSALHCVHFNKMDRDLRVKVVSSIMVMFSPDNISFEQKILDFVGNSDVELIPETFLADFTEEERPKKRFLGFLK